MSSDSSANGSVDRPADAPVLDPRPVYRPQIDPASRQVFGRPSGVEGSFTPVAAASIGLTGRGIRAEEAFARRLTDIFEHVEFTWSGMPGLRVTRIQHYKSLYERQQRF